MYDILENRRGIKSIIILLGRKKNLILVYQNEERNEQQTKRYNKSNKRES